MPRTPGEAYHDGCRVMFTEGGKTTLMPKCGCEFDGAYVYKAMITAALKE